MPTNKNALTRIALLDKLLADRYHAYSIQDMTDYLEQELPQYGQEGGVTKRCVEKDIEYLEYKFPILIEFERYNVEAYSAKSDKAYMKRCIRYADPTFSIFKGKLTEEEKGLLITAISTIGSFDGLDGFGWLDDLRKRLDFVVQRPLIQMSKNLIENKTLMAEAFSAIQARSTIQLGYKLFNSSEKKDIIISPYLLKEYNRRWYLIGGAYDTDKILTFALDRVIGITILLGYEYHDAPDNLYERYEDIIGITYYDEKPIEKIIFWVSDKTFPYIDTKPIHGSQRKIKGERDTILRGKYKLSEDGGALYSIECKENYELIRELCSFGGDLKVLTPDNIVHSIKERIKLMCDRYNIT